MSRKIALFIVLACGMLAPQLNAQQICYDEDTGEMYFTSLVGVSSLNFVSNTPVSVEQVAFTGQYFNGSTQLLGDIFTGTTGTEILLGTWDADESKLDSFGPVTVSYGDGSLGEINIEVCAAVPEPSLAALLLPVMALGVWRRRK